MSERTPRLGAPYIRAAQAQKEVTHNAALNILDALVQAVVEDRDLTTPPTSPEDGSLWIVATGAGGDWAGHDGELAQWIGGAWAFHSLKRLFISFRCALQNWLPFLSVSST